jgi:hypothetical protein
MLLSDSIFFAQRHLSSIGGENKFSSYEFRTKPVSA